MNSEILKNWEPEKIRESQLNDKKINSYTTVYQIKKEKPNLNQVSPENISVRTLWRQCDRLKISNGMLYREW